VDHVKPAMKIPGGFAGKKGIFSALENIPVL
jgi:hypothetical protein